MINGVDTTHHNLTGAQLKAAGKAFVCRYIQNAPGSTLDKQMRTEELAEKSAAGVRVVANWEWAANPPNDRIIGKAHAILAKQRLAALGVPDWAPVYYSIDTGLQANSRTAYAQGWRDVYPADQLGVYTCGALFRQLKADGHVKYAWQSMSRSFPGNHLIGQPDIWDHRGADLIQTTATDIGGLSCDLDYATVDDYGGFLMGEEDPNMALTAQDVVDALKADPSYVDLCWRVQAMAEALDTYANGSMKGQSVDLTALLKKIPTATMPAAPIDYAALAKAVNDDAAKRLAS